MIEGVKFSGCIYLNALEIPQWFDYHGTELDICCY